MPRQEGMTGVTEENFGDLLIEGLTEARRIVRGEAEPARQVGRARTARATEVESPRPYPAQAIQRIRERMGLSQSLFAKVLNASTETVKAWEQGKRTPDGIALALLQVADRHPGVLMERVHEKGRSPEPEPAPAASKP